MYKLCKFRENRARDTPLWGVYIPKFGQISAKFLVWGSYTLIVAPMAVKCGIHSSEPHFTAIGQRVAPTG